MENFGMAMLWYWTAYLLVTAVGILHTIFNITVLHMKSMKDSPGMGEDTKKQSPGILYITLLYSQFLPGCTSGGWKPSRYPM